jgi:hypothetical protein
MLKHTSTTISNALISQPAIWLLNSGVDIKEIRLKNLRLLIAEVGTAAELSRRAKTDPAYLSQILSTKIKRGLGDELARRLERATGKPHGYMDHLNIAEEIGVYKKEKGVSAISFEEDALLKKYRKLSAKERTQLQAISDALVTAKHRKDKTGT